MNPTEKTNTTAARSSVAATTYGQALLKYAGEHGAQSVYRAGRTARPCVNHTAHPVSASPTNFGLSVVGSANPSAPRVANGGAPAGNPASVLHINERRDARAVQGVGRIAEADRRWWARKEGPLGDKRKPETRLKPVCDEREVGWCSGNAGRQPVMQATFSNRQVTNPAAAHHVAKARGE